MIARGMTPGLLRRGPLDPAGIGDELVTAGVVAGAIALSSYALATGRTTIAVGLALMPLAAILVASPAVSLVLLGSSIPLLFGLPGLGLDYQIAVSDVFLVLVTASLLVAATATGSIPALHALRPVRLPLLLYCGAVLVLLGYHLAPSVAAQTAQRFELLLLPLLVGAYAALSGRQVPVLQAYVLSTTLFALAWSTVVLGDLGGQKNPVGQLFGNAIIVVIGIPALRRLMPCLLILVPALLVTGSRGAVIATAIGIAVVAAMQGLRARRVAVRVLPVALIAAAAFFLMPAATQERLTTLSAQGDTKAAWAIRYRELYTASAWRVIHEHPWTGVGVGNYLDATADGPGRSDDPHHVLLLQAAEGGYGFATVFVILIAGVAIVLYRMRSLEVAPAATGVLLATAAHGLVDVYWVRGTPVLGWLLVGMACGAFHASRQPDRLRS